MTNQHNDIAAQLRKLAFGLSTVAGPEVYAARGSLRQYAEALEALSAAGSVQAEAPNFIVSAVVIKDIPTGVNVMNKLYAVQAASQDEAHGKVLALCMNDFPEHRLHSICAHSTTNATQPPASPAAPAVQERLALKAALAYIKNHTPYLVHSEISAALASPPAAQEKP